MVIIITAKKFKRRREIFETKIKLLKSEDGKKKKKMQILLTFLTRKRCSFWGEIEELIFILGRSN